LSHGYVYFAPRISRHPVSSSLESWDNASNTPTAPSQLVIFSRWTSRFQLLKTLVPRLLRVTIFRETRSAKNSLKVRRQRDSHWNQITPSTTALTITSSLPHLRNSCRSLHG
ncbi:hypothetical protein ANCCAN_11296, partial [Ancylostoma caninum]